MIQEKEEIFNNRSAMMESREGYIDIAEGKVHYVEWGDGEPLHLLHANGFCGGAYEPLVKYFHDRYRVTATDIPGQGDSLTYRKGKVKKWEPLAADMTEYFPRKMDTPVTAIGHSLGAVLTLMVAAEHPDMFRKIVVMDPVIFSPRLIMVFRIMRLFGQGWRIPVAVKARRRRRSFDSREDAYNRFHAGRGMFKTWQPEFIDSYLGCVFTEDGAGYSLKHDAEYEAQIFETIPLNIWSYLKRIETPVLVLRGENSDTFRRDAAEKLKGLRSNIQVEDIPGTGHFLPMERPDLCAQRILDFIEKE